MSGEDKIVIEFDNATGSYFASLLPPPAVGAGDTALKALQDLRRAAYNGIDTLSNIKLVDIKLININSQNIKKQEV
jgi:hypothetical protein